MKTKSFYKKNLAHIHDTGFSFFAEGASKGILEILEKHDIHNGHIVDLGCGSGILAKNLTEYGYTVTGVDLSPDMISLAKEKVPNAHFVTSSFYSFNVPPCNAVTATGECFNYLFDNTHSLNTLSALFERIYKSLTPCGLFIFDFARPGRVNSSKKKKWKQDDWEMDVEHFEDEHLKILTRKIRLKIFTQNGMNEDSEIHRLRLFEKDDLKTVLLNSGFSVKFITGYGSYTFPFESGYGGFVAEKK